MMDLESTRDKSTQTGGIGDGLFILENLCQLNLSGDHSDLTLVVEGQRFRTHKLILAAQSKFFEAMLFGNFEESSKAEIELKGISAAGFAEFLKYIYTGRLSLCSLEEKVVFEILRMAYMYALPTLATSVTGHLKEHFKTENVYFILQTASELNLLDLVEDCLVFIDQNAEQVLQSDKFLQLSANLLSEILSRDSFFASEIQIFQALQKWIKANPSGNAKDISKYVRLELMTQKELLSDVRSSGFFSSEEILDAQAIALEAKYAKMRFRGVALYDQNVAHIKYQPKLVTGQKRSSFFIKESGPCSGFASSSISDENGLTIELGTQYLINHIKLFLLTSDIFYYVEISVDKETWLRVIDYSDFCCCGWQYLYFEPKVVKFIRIVAVESLEEREHFSVIGLEAFYRPNHKETLTERFIVPSYNVATPDLGASCILYDSERSDDYYVLRDSSENCRGEFTTPHEELDSIIVQLARPYMIDSIRMLLRELDDHWYSYWVEVSGNYKDWEMVIDKRQEKCQGWQFLTFDRSRPVVFIRITATPESVEQGFGLVRFECPAVVDDKKNKKMRTQ